MSVAKGPNLPAAAGCSWHYRAPAKRCIGNPPLLAVSWLPTPQVLEDMALERSEDADVVWLQEALQEAAPALALDGRQLHSHLFRRLALHFPAPPLPPTSPGAAAPEPKAWVSVPPGRALPRAALAACDAPPSPALLPIPTNVPDDVPDHLDLIVRIRDYPDYVVAVSTAREEIAVWDILRYSTHKGIIVTQPRDPS